MRSVPAVLLSALVLLAAPAQAQRDPRELRSEQRAREEERDRLRADAADLRADVERLRAELIRLGAAQAVGERDVGGKRSALEQLNARETALRARMARTRAEQARLLGALQLYSRHPPPALFVSPGSAKNAVRAAILMRAVAPELERRADRFASETAALTDARRRAAVASEALFTAESSVADRRGAIERLVQQKAALERSLLLDAEQADAEARALAARASSLGGLIGEVAEASPSQPALAAPRRLTAPAEGPLVRRFGDATPGGRLQGVLIRTEPRAQVRSPADARVQFAGVLKGYGVVVILRTGGAYDLVLAGLDSAAPPPGGRVAAGEPIGRMAATSRPAPELYLEVRRNGAPVDPSALLPSPVLVAAPSAQSGLRGAIKPSG